MAKKNSDVRCPSHVRCIIFICISIVDRHWHDVVCRGVWYESDIPYKYLVDLFTIDIRRCTALHKCSEMSLFR